MKVSLVGSLYSLWKPVTPAALYVPGRMVAGGETALIRVSQQLAARGHEVFVYAFTDKEADWDGVRWIPLASNGTFVRPSAPVDIAISFDTPVPLHNIQAHISLLACQTNDPPMAGAPDISAFTFCSNWHLDAVCRRRTMIPRERAFVIGNGVDLELYAQRESVPKIPGRLLWTSSPDRGLHHALRIFRLAREQRPDLTLHVYYDFSKAFEGSKWAMDLHTQNLWEAKKLMETTEGVTYVGPVDKRTLAQAEMEAEVLLMSEDTVQPTEGYGISVISSMAAGCIPLISDCDALPELWGRHTPMLPLPIDYGQWTQALLDLLGDKPMQANYRALGYARAAECGWDRVGEQYDALLRRLYAEKPCPTCGRPLGTHAPASASAHEPALVG